MNRWWNNTARKRFVLWLFRNMLLVFLTFVNSGFAVKAYIAGDIVWGSFLLTAAFATGLFAALSLDDLP